MFWYTVLKALSIGAAHRAMKYPLSTHCLLSYAALLALGVTLSASCLALPALPENLFIPDRTGDFIDGVRLELLGAPLIVSNAPESIRSTGPVALYRAEMRSRHFRVFYHHRNAVAGRLLIGVAITNPADAPGPVEIYTGPNSQLLPLEERSTVHPDPATAGWRAMRNWFVSRMRIEGNRWLHTLRPGQTRYLLQAVPLGATVTGMYDFGVRFAGPIEDPPAVTVAVIASPGVPRSADALPMAHPVDPDGTWHRRGVFAHADRWAQVECDVPGVRWLDLAGPIEGENSNAMLNEMQPAIDYDRGLNPGNYGVVYTLHIVLRNTGDRPLRVRCLLAAAGGAGFTGLMLERGYIESGRLLKPYEAWPFAGITLEPGASKSFNLKFTLPGGSCGAQRIYFWPEPL